MKVIILAGGFGTRLEEETSTIPKPMVEIGGKPILWHLMKHYAHFGFNEFFLALGYKGNVIKDFFMKYPTLSNNFTVDIKTGTIKEYKEIKEDWIVHLIDTGLNSMTGGRVKRLEKWVSDETFMLTYGDGLSNINLKELFEFHQKHGKFATITAVRPPARFGELIFNNDFVINFAEKPLTTESWINGGFFVLEPEVFDYIKDDMTIWEREPLENLAKENQLVGYRLEGFWQCMDNLRDLRYLRSLWDSGNPPWKLWEE